MLFVQAYRFQQLVHALGAALFGVHAVDLHTLGNDVAHRHAGVQRGIWVLKNNLRLFGILKAVLRSAQVHFLALIFQLAGGGVIDAHHHAPQGGFAAARFAYHAKRFAPVDIQRDAIHGFQRFAVAHVEVFAYVFKGNEFFTVLFCHSQFPSFLCTGQAGCSRQQAALWPAPTS